ncbi:MAG: dephospho-CoA kinase [Solirubrobacterales bacterium]
MSGGVAAGKSTALESLAQAGIPTLSADQVVHEIYASEEVAILVAERLGSEVIVDGVVDRDAVGRGLDGSESANGEVSSVGVRFAAAAQRSLER